ALAAKAPPPACGWSPSPRRARGGLWAAAVSAAVAQPGGAELLAVEEAVEDAGAGDLARVLEEQPDLLEQPLLAAHVEAEQDVVRRQELGDQVHEARDCKPVSVLRNALDAGRVARVE